MTRLMFIPFNNMPDYARIWVYQTNKNLTDLEVHNVEQFLKNQINVWAAHGADLVGSVQVSYNRFVVVAVDEIQNQVSGCSIDASTQWLRELGAELNIDFFDRSIAFLKNNELQTVEIGNIKSLVIDEILTPETMIFNNLVSNIQEFKNNWNVKASDCWMKRYFQTVTT